MINLSATRVALREMNTAELAEAFARHILDRPNQDPKDWLAIVSLFNQESNRRLKRRA